MYITLDFLNNIINFHFILFLNALISIVKLQAKGNLSFRVDQLKSFSNKV